MARTDFVQQRNTTEVFTLTLLSSNDVTPINPSGLTVRWQCRLGPRDSAPILEKTISAGLVVGTDQDGAPCLLLTISAADTCQIAPQGKTVATTWALGVETDQPHLPLAGTLTITANALDTTP